MKKIYLLLFVVFILSCSTTVQYVGKSYGRGTDAEVFVSESEIKRPYSIIGRGYIKPGIGPHGINWNQVQRNAIKKAWFHGADAVLIVQKNAVGTMPVMRSYDSIDSIGSVRLTNSHTEMYYPVSAWHDILFLKYK